MPAGLGVAICIPCGDLLQHQIAIGSDISAGGKKIACGAGAEADRCTRCRLDGIGCNATIVLIARQVGDVNGATGRYPTRCNVQLASRKPGLHLPVWLWIAVDSLWGGLFEHHLGRCQIGASAEYCTGVLRADCCL